MWVDNLNNSLKIPENLSPKVIDLFAGCGGLALGFEAAGFETIGFEKDGDASETYRTNLRGACSTIELSVGYSYPNAGVVIGGPPCQPFSVGGLQLGLKDSRDGFPIFIDAVSRLKPEIWLFENVRGMLYSNKQYFEEIIQTLKSLGYIVEFKLLNAVDYSVPQNRERVIVVGHRGDFLWPAPHAKQVTAGDAVGDYAVTAPEESKFLTPSMDQYVAKYEKASCCVRPRDLHLEKPARTLTCRNLAGATGDMHRVRLPDGRRRRLLIREAARLQSFPDWFSFTGSEISQFNQIGNAVPPLFAKAIALSVKRYLESRKRYTSSEIVYRNLPDQMELSLFTKEDSPMPAPKYVTTEKPKEIDTVINQALHILQAVGIPFDGLTSRRLEKMAMAFLAVCDVKRSRDWSSAKAWDGSRALKSRDIIDYINKSFSEDISRGSYDDIRRKDLKLPVLAGLIIRSANDPDSARNDPTRAYALSPEYADIVRAYGGRHWVEAAEEFMASRPTLSERLNNARTTNLIPVTLPDGVKIEFSPGDHNILQKAIIEEFLPRFGYSAEVLYVGDTAEKYLLLNSEGLAKIKFFEIAHGELPDIVAYSKGKKWLYLIEAVHSSGPISPTRLLELKELTKDCTAEIVYVTAFLSRDTFRKFAPDIAWETEVWIADAPDHIIHFNGERFLGPYSAKG